MDKTSRLDKTTLNLGYRFSQLRKEKGYTQSDFASEFASYCGFTKPITVSTVSSWEQNRRLPPIETIAFLSQFFGVTVDYLLNLSDNRYGDTSDTRKKASEHALISYGDTPIAEADLVNYDKLPVFIKFKNNSHLSQWGILNVSQRKVICESYAVSITMNVELYPYSVQPPVRTQITQLKNLLNNEYVWVKMKSSDPSVVSLYDGRYRHNEDKTHLVNIANGVVLPYAGLDLSYWAFKG